MDSIIGPYVTKAPSFTFRRACSLRDHLTSSEFKQSRRKCSCKLPGTFTCGGCKYCQYRNTTKNLRLPNGDGYRPKHYANCQTKGVVYLLLCQCSSYYVGKTIQPFWKRAYRHILSMKSCNPDLPLGRHVTNIHSGVPPKMYFIILDTSPRGGDTNKLLLQIEQKWIFTLNATPPPFLEGFSSGGSEWDPP